MDTKNLSVMLGNNGSVLAEQMHRMRDNKNSHRRSRDIAMLRRTIKRHERAEWRNEVANPTDDRQAFEAYEDRQRILDHLSDTWWHGVHEPSDWVFYSTLHNAARASYGMEQLRSAA